MVRRLAAIALAVALAPAARAADSLGLTIQVMAGSSRYDVDGLQDGVSTQGRDLLQSRAMSYGASALLRLGGLDLGVLYEGRLIRSRTDSAVLTPVLGLALPLGEVVRIDLLGELGGHRISGIQFEGGVDTTQAETVWLPYVGVRPMLTFRFPLGPIRAVASLAGFARWDLIRREASVTVTEGGVQQPSVPYRLGGTTFGFALGAGLEL
jgi:opacity protein-like surface antigen